MALSHPLPSWLFKAAIIPHLCSHLGKGSIFPVWRGGRLGGKFYVASPFLSLSAGSQRGMAVSYLHIHSWTVSTSIKGPQTSYGFRLGSSGSIPQDIRQHMGRLLRSTLGNTEEGAGRKLNWAKGTNGLQSKAHAPSQLWGQDGPLGLDLQTNHYIWAARGRRCDLGRVSSWKGLTAESVPEKGWQLKAVSQGHSQHLGVKSFHFEGES